MIELLRTNDMVLISYVSALLADAGVDAVVLDAHMSVLEGSIGAIPRRIMVPTDSEALARSALTAAGIDLPAPK